MCAGGVSLILPGVRFGMVSQDWVTFFLIQQTPLLNCIKIQWSLHYPNSLGIGCVQIIKSLDNQANLFIYTAI